MGVAQPNALIDSLQQLLQNATNNETKVDWLNDLAWEYKFSDPQQARTHLDDAIALAVQLAYKKGEGQAYNNLGVVETIHDNKDLAIRHYSKALAIRTTLDDQKGVASLYNNIGNLYAEQDSFSVAIANLKKSLQIRETLQDTQRIARVHYNLADAYEGWGDYTAALDHAFAFREWSALSNDPYSLLNAHNLMGNIFSELERWQEAGEQYLKAMTLAEQVEDNWEIAIACNNMGNHKDDLAERAYKDGQFDIAFPEFVESIRLHQKALALRQSLEDEPSQSDSYNNLGVVYKNFGSFYAALSQPDSAASCFQQALQYFEQSLSIRTIQEDQKGIMEVYNGIGDVKRRQGLWKEALDYTNRYLDIAVQINDGKFQQKAFKDLSRVYASSDNYQLAYDFQRKYDDLRYERLSEDRVRMNTRREALFGDFNKQLELERKEAQLKQEAIQRRALTGGGIALLLLLGLLYSRYQIKHKANTALAEKNKIIASEQEKAEALLLNILPEATAHELKQQGKTTARHYSAVSVLFTDFKSFTEVTQQMSAEELVSLLDQCYRMFDEIISKYGIEKIKTIGDAYMCVAGLPTESDQHAIQLVHAGLDMQEAMSALNHKRAAKGLPVLLMRLGIHSGPVVAGVVGSKKFAFDIWGDTVNQAAWMEANGEVGQVNISGTTYELVKNEFDCHHLGPLKTKNNKEIDRYLVKKAAKQRP